jgi:hypothetical protein
MTSNVAIIMWFFLTPLSCQIPDVLSVAADRPAIVPRSSSDAAADELPPQGGGSTAAHPRTVLTLATNTRVTALVATRDELFIGTAEQMMSPLAFTDTPGSLIKVPRQGAAAETLWTGSAPVVAIAPTSTSLIFVTYSFAGRTGAIYSRAGDSGELSTVRQWSAHGSCVTVAAGTDGGAAYVAFTEGSEGPILAVTASGPTTTVAQDGCIAGLAPGPANLSWATSASIKCQSLADAAPVTIWQGRSTLSTLARYRSGNYIFADEQGVHILAADGSSSSSRMQGQLGSLVAVGDVAFGADADAGTIAMYFDRGRLPAATLLLSGESRPTLLTSDGSALFWSNDGAHQIRAVTISGQAAGSY